MKAYPKPKYHPHLNCTSTVIPFHNQRKYLNLCNFIYKHDRNQHTDLSVHELCKSHSCTWESLIQYLKFLRQLLTSSYSSLNNFHTLTKHLIFKVHTKFNPHFCQRPNVYVRHSVHKKATEFTMCKDSIKPLHHQHQSEYWSTKSLHYHHHKS
jgi:hypothetical protein